MKRVLTDEERRAIRRVIKVVDGVIKHFHRPEIAFALDDRRGSIWTFREVRQHLRAADRMLQPRRRRR